MLYRGEVLLGVYHTFIFILMIALIDLFNEPIFHHSTGGTRVLDTTS